MVCVVELLLPELELLPELLEALPLLLFPEDELLPPLLLVLPLLPVFPVVLVVLVVPVVLPSDWLPDEVELLVLG